jgi:hypothetical protein
MYICTLCNYENKNFRYFNQHCMTKYHIKKEQIDSCCYLCKKTFLSLKTYKQHKKSFHKLNNNIKKPKKKIITNNTDIIINTNDADIINTDNNNNITPTTNISNNELITDVKQEIKKSNKEIIYKIDQVKEEIKEEITTEIREVKNVVNNAINRASCLIKILMDNYKTTPPLKKITDKECIKTLRLIYKIPLKRPNNYLLEEELVRNYIQEIFIDKITKTILELVNYKKPQTQPIYNTDSTRYNYVIKHTEDNWNVDKAGVKFTEFVIKPLLNHINDLLQKYIKTNFTNTKVYGKTAEEIRDHFTKYNNTLNLCRDIENGKLVKPILKEISPYLRYLELELDELEKINQIEKIQNELQNIFVDTRKKS